MLAPAKDVASTCDRGKRMFESITRPTYGARAAAAAAILLAMAIAIAATLVTIEVARAQISIASCGHSAECAGTAES